MDLKEAKELLKEGIVYSVGNKRTGMAESCKEYQEAIDTILQELDNLQKENDGKDCIIETLDHNEKVKDGYIKHLEEKTRNSISKNKIREKIEEIKDKKLNVNGWDSEFEYATEALQDLLKEE